MKGSPRIVVALAALGVVLAAVCAGMRLHGWALEFPLDWLLAVASLAPAAFAALMLVTAIATLVRAPATERIRSAAPMFVIALGYGVAAWGMRGACVSLNPFLWEPLPADALPSRGPALLACVDFGVVLVEPDRHGVYQYAPGEGMLVQQYVHEAYWDASARRLVYQTENTYETYAATLDGRHERLLALSEADPCWSGCTLLESSQIGCVRTYTDSQTSTTRTITCVRPLAAGDDDVLEWSPPLAEAGPAVLLSDGARVIFADRCQGDAFGHHCVFAAARNGSSRTMLAALEGDACVIAVSRDRAHVAVAAHVGDAPCSRVYRVDIDGAGAHPIADFVPEQENGYGGVSVMTFSPDGTELAVLSDELDGCAGSEGVTSCPLTMTILRIDGTERRRVSRTPIDAQALVWVQ